MEDPGREGQEGEESPGAAFATAPFDLVTTEPRSAILDVLATRQAADPADPSVGFAALREAAGITDSGNFNYHLDKLQPAYVRQTDDGYALTFAGLSLVGILRAGVGAETTRGPERLDATCPLCGHDLVARYEDGLLSVVCDQGHKQPQEILPPNAVEGRSLREVVDILTRRTQHHLDLVRRGVCPACFDAVERAYRQLDESPSHVVVATCEGCGLVSGSPVGLYLLCEPVVVAFYHDHGVDVTEAPLWELDLWVAEPTVCSREPLRLSLSVELDGERLTLVVDKSTHLVESTRTETES